MSRKKQPNNIFAVVDIGNSAAKVSRIIKGIPQPLKVYPLEKLSKLVTEQLPGEIGRVVVGCSGHDDKAKHLSAQIFARGGESVLITRDCIIPFISLYAPGQAGVDRLANVAAAIAIDKKNPAIVVDAGSAITVEKIGPNSVYRGGIIMPGFQMQAQALNNGTAALPHVEIHPENTDESAPPADDLFIVPGTNTENAITGGIMMACIGGVMRTIEKYLQADDMTEAHLYFTGGDGELILKGLKASAGWNKLIKTDQVSYDSLWTLKGLLELSPLQEA